MLPSMEPLTTLESRYSDTKTGKKKKKKAAQLVKAPLETSIIALYLLSSIITRCKRCVFGNGN